MPAQNRRRRRHRRQAKLGLLEGQPGGEREPLRGQPRIGQIDDAFAVEVDRHRLIDVPELHVDHPPRLRPAHRDRSLCAPGVLVRPLERTVAHRGLVLRARIVLADRELEDMASGNELEPRVETRLIGDDARRDPQVADVEDPHVDPALVPEHVVGSPVVELPAVRSPLQRGRLVGAGSVAPGVVDLPVGRVADPRRPPVGTRQPTGMQRQVVAVVHRLPDGSLDVLGLALDDVVVEALGLVGRPGEDVAVHQPDLLAPQADQPLDVVLRGAVGIGRVLEDHDVETPRLTEGIEGLEHENAVTHPDLGLQLPDR